MKIELIKDSMVRVCEIGLSQCFRYGDRVFMAVATPGNNREGSIPAVNLSNGMLIDMDRQTAVIPVNLKAVEEKV